MDNHDIPNNDPGLKILHHLEKTKFPTGDFFRVLDTAQVVGWKQGFVAGAIWSAVVVALLFLVKRFLTQT